MLEISLDDSDLKRGLEQLLHNARHPRPMMRAIAAELLSITEDNFAHESWGGRKWPATARGGKILQKSGQLAASIHTASGSNFARIGTNKPYAAIHQFGGTIEAKSKPYLMIPVPGGGFRRKAKVTIPARPYLPMSKGGTLQAGAESRLLDVALDALARGVRK